MYYIVQPSTAEEHYNLILNDETQLETKPAVTYNDLPDWYDSKKCKQ